MNKNTDYPYTRRTAWTTLGLLLLLMVFGLMDRVLISSVFPQLKADWQLSDTQLGMLVSAVNWSMALFAMPVAVLVDRWSKKKAIGLMAGVWTLATVSCGLANNFFQMFVARMFIGAGEGGYGPGGASMLSALFPVRLRATVMSLLNAAGSVGGVLGVAIGAYIAAHWGWRNAFIVVAIPGFLIILLFMLAAPTLPVVPLEAARGQKITVREQVRSLFSTPSLIAVYLAGICVIYFNISLIAWIPSYFNRAVGLPMDRAGGYSAVVLLVSAVGVVLGGAIGDRARRRGEHLMLKVPAMAILFSGVAFALAFSCNPHGGVFLPVLLAGSLFSSFCLGPLFAVSQAVVHPGLHATTVGMMNLIWQMLGGMGPILTGMLSDRLGIQAALGLNAGMLCMAAIVMFWGSHHLAADAARATAMKA